MPIVVNNLMKTPANKLSLNSLVNDLRRVAVIVGNVPTFRQYAEHGLFHPSSLVNHFGSFNKSKQQAFGGEVKPYRLSKQSIADDLKSVKNKIGHIPSKAEYHLHGLFTEQSIIPRYSSWNNALLDVFGSTHEAAHTPREISCEECSKMCFKTPCKIQQSKHHFCSQSCASIFAQKHKTYGVNKSRMEKYITSHLNYNFPIRYNSRKEIALELDIFVPTLKLAFEINGIFHFKPIFGKRKLERTQQCDQLKITRCADSGITLHIIDITSMRNFNEKEAMLFVAIIKNIIESHSLKA